MKVYKYNNVFAHIEQTLLEQYDKNPLFDKVCLVLGYNVLGSLDFLREKLPGFKMIVYQLEQLYSGSPWVSSTARELLKSADEIWDYDEGNIKWMRVNYYLDAKFKPLVYTKCLKVLPPIDEKECDVDVLFYGYLHERRGRFLINLQHKAAGKFKIFDLYGIWGKDLDEYIKRSKIIINIHTKDFARQEQARIYYPVINGRCVLSERSPINYMGDSIVEANYEDMLVKTMEMLYTKNWLNVAKQASENYKLFSERFNEQK